jgi:hypothetical protein
MNPLEGQEAFLRAVSSLPFLPALGGEVYEAGVWGQSPRLRSKSAAEKRAVRFNRLFDGHLEAVCIFESLIHPNNRRALFDASHVNGMQLVSQGHRRVAQHLLQSNRSGLFFSPISTHWHDSQR